MRKGWLIAFAAMGLNLTLGVIYSWSVFNKVLSKPIAEGGYGWTDSMGGWPFTLSIVVWAVLMIPAGRLQDKIGPRLIITLGAIFLGIGMFISSFAAPVPAGLACTGAGWRRCLGGARCGVRLATSSNAPWSRPARAVGLSGCAGAGIWPP